MNYEQANELISVLKDVAYELNRNKEELSKINDTLDKMYQGMY